MAAVAMAGGAARCAACTGARAAAPRRTAAKVQHRAVRAHAGAAVEEAADDAETADLPTPVVIIDNTSDPAATIVKVQFGDRLGLLLDTIEALRDHDLDIVRGLCETEDEQATNSFYVTGIDGEKVTDPQRIEDMRLTIISNMVEYHPEAGAKFNEGPSHPKSQEPTKIRVRDSEDGKCSLVDISTPDRAGLLIDIVKTFKDINVSVFSAEIDTEGLVAKDTFRVTYHGLPLDKNMSTLVKNALIYYLANRGKGTDLNEDSY